jgi:LysM repeat protein
MRLRVSLFALAVMLVAPSAASASFVHTVAPGESLYSIAAADGLSVSQLAAANGLSSGSSLVAGSSVQIPSQSSSSVASVGSSSACDGDGDSDDVSCGAAASPTCDGDGDSDDVGCGGSSAPTSVSSTSSGGSYVVQPGDTLTAIAARAGVSPASLAAANGLSPDGVLVAGTALRLSGTPSSLPTTSSSAVAAAQPVGAAAQGSPVNPPYPTSQRVSASEVGQVAAAGGVSPSLAQAIAYQESGFNNAAVSSADARGVMQILPGTWNYIQNSLQPGTPLAPASAIDNVRGGVALLHSLLNATGGDPAMAAAGYYQGLPSVQKYGLFPDTQRYVQSVMALRSRFAGGG